MPELPNGQIKPDYQAYLDQLNIPGYVAALCEDGLKWWFEMDTPAILTHLMPLQAFAGQSLPEAVPTRLLLLSQAINPATPLQTLEQLYEQLIAEKDFEAAAVCAGAGVANIWDSGWGFAGYLVWHERLGDLLAPADVVSPLAAASMHGFRGLVEMTGFGSPPKAEESYRNLLLMAEKAGSSSLRLFFAAAASYALLWQGRISEAQMLVDDMAPLCALPETSGVCNIYYQTTAGLVRTICGKPDEARAVLEAVVNLPFFSELPPPVFYLGHGHLLHAISHSSAEEDIDRIADRIRERAVPEQNYFHHSYLHFNLGVAYLGANAPKKAFVHSEEAIRRGHLSKSPISVNMPSFLHGQALADLGRVEEAKGHLLGCLEKWAATGYQILAAAGALELAAISVKRGETDEARKYYDKAVAYMPSGEPLPSLHRPDGFPARLAAALFPGDNGTDHLTPEKTPVMVETFGSLAVTIADITIYDRNWHGKGTKNLLIALIVCGGVKVGVEKICDLLWPDCEGDKAYSNLKMALSRLRRVGCAKGENPLPWIVMKQKKISLVKSLCRVDALVFQENMCRAQRADDPGGFLKTAIDLYRDDFLSQDHSAAWIVNHADLLRSQYILAVTEYAGLCQRKGEAARAIDPLTAALGRKPFNEELCALLMQCNLTLGYPARALEVYRKAETLFSQKLGIRPGEVMRKLADEAGGLDD